MPAVPLQENLHLSIRKPSRGMSFPLCHGPPAWPPSPVWSRSAEECLPAGWSPPCNIPALPQLTWLACPCGCPAAGSAGVVRPPGCSWPDQVPCSSPRRPSLCPVADGGCCLRRPPCCRGSSPPLTAGLLLQGRFWGQRGTTTSMPAASTRPATPSNGRGPLPRFKSLSPWTCPTAMRCSGRSGRIGR